ncbi:MAG: hypothetical protein WED33_03100 [Bacteroidia bacterium]
MQLVDKVKLSIGHAILNREVKELIRERTDPDIHRAASIGILYDATDREEFFEVREFFKDLRDSRKKAVTLGYIDYKETLSFHPLARPESDYFFKNQLNWLSQPSASVVDHFIQEPFDILINLSMKDLFPLDYIAAKSKAGLKIGRASSAISNHYDISFHMAENADLESFAYTIIHYLSQINNERSTSNSRKRSSHYYTV